VKGGNPKIKKDAVMYRRGMLTDVTGRQIGPEALVRLKRGGIAKVRNNEGTGTDLSLGHRENQT